nr:hypothetical protein [Aeromonas dhakensis]
MLMAQVDLRRRDVSSGSLSTAWAMAKNTSACPVSLLREALNVSWPPPVVLRLILMKASGISMSS